MPATIANLAMMRSLLGGGTGLTPQAIKLGAITQAPSMGGMSGGGHTPSLGSVPSPQIINPAGDPLLSRNAPNSIFNRAEKDVVDRFDDYMNNQWLPQGPTREATNKMYEQGYGTKENPGALWGALPDGFGQTGANLVGAPPEVQQQWAALGQQVKQQQIAQAQQEANAAYQKGQLEIGRKNAESARITANASMLKAQKTGTGKKGSGGSKKGSVIDPYTYGSGPQFSNGLGI